MENEQKNTPEKEKEPKKSLKKIKQVEVAQSTEMQEYHEQRTSVESMISQAIEKGVDPDTMQKFLDMRKELKKEWAKEQFDRAMAKFQAECPVIKKTKFVYERDKVTVRYKYADLDSIIDQTKELIAENGLSYTFKTKSDEKMFSAIVTVAHISGHREETSFDIPISSEQFMTEIQKYAARSTFAKRYAFMNAFGIMTGDEDSEAEVAKEDGSQVEEAIKKLDACKDAKEFNDTVNSFPKEIKANKDVLAHAVEVKKLILAKKNENS